MQYNTLQNHALCPQLSLACSVSLAPRVCQGKLLAPSLYKEKEGKAGIIRQIPGTYSYIWLQVFRSVYDKAKYMYTITGVFAMSKFDPRCQTNTSLLFM